MNAPDSGEAEIAETEQARYWGLEEGHELPVGAEPGAVAEHEIRDVHPGRLSWSGWGFWVWMMRMAM